MKRIMQYYAEYAVVLYSLGMRAAFYTVLIRFSSSREQWYPDKLVHCCCTQARNALGLLSLLSEVVDASLALQCGSGLYLARRAIGDSVTLARCASAAGSGFQSDLACTGTPRTKECGRTDWPSWLGQASGRSSTARFMGLVPFCSVYGRPHAISVVLCRSPHVHQLVNLLIEIKMKKPNSRYVRHWSEA